MQTRQRVVATLVAAAERIVDEAMHTLERAHLRHYEQAGQASCRARLDALLGVTTECVSRGDPSLMRRHGERIARERYHHGYDIAELQTAFNDLEESIWRVLRTNLDDAAFLEGIARVTAIVGIGKDAMVRTYVALVREKGLVGVDVGALESGVASGAHSPDEDA